MSMEFKIRKIGDSLGIVLSEEALRTLKVGEGDSLYLAEGPEQSVVKESDFSEVMKIAEEGMDRYRNALRELAK